MKDDEIIQIFKDAGMCIELGAQYSVRGQIAQLLNGCKKLIAVPTPVEDRQARPCRFKDDACRLGPDYPCDACAVYSPAKVSIY